MATPDISWDAGEFDFVRGPVPRCWRPPPVRLGGRLARRRTGGAACRLAHRLRLSRAGDRAQSLWRVCTGAQRRRRYGSPAKGGAGRRYRRNPTARRRASGERLRRDRRRGNGGLLCAFSARRAACQHGRHPALADVYQSLSLLPVLSALAAVPLGLLKRRRRHATLFAIRLTGTTLGAGAVIGLGLAGSGAWCLVAQVVIQCFVEAALSWAAMRRGIGFGYSGRHVRELFATLPAAAMAPAFAAVDKQLPRFLVGSMLGPTAAGLYLLASVIAEAVAAGLALAAILCELALPRTRDGLAPLVEGVCFVAAPAAVCVSGSMQWLMTEIDRKSTRL